MAEKITWKTFVYEHVLDHCNNAGSRTFSLKELLADKQTIFEHFRPDTNTHPSEKIRQVLQDLRKEGKLIFVDNNGHYTLQGVDLL